jgi:Secretion system C-terminal sorting domain
MKKLLLSLGLILMGFTHCYSQCSTGLFFSEFHYDNSGTDANERIEITGLAGTNLTGYSIVLYNGTSAPTAATSYTTTALSGIISDQGGGKGTLVFSYPSNGIQNGANDGFALVSPSNVVIEFLSYEGVITAGDGPANGLTSTDVGVSENGTSGDANGSIQRTTCSTWIVAPTSNNFGILPPSPLPVTLISFKATLNERQQATLKWATASEFNNDFFEIERSKNATDFESLGKIVGRGTVQGQNDYTFTDEVPLKGINYYRLKQVDYDGQFSYSRLSSVIKDGDGTISLFPNPTANVLKINFEDADQIENVTFYNAFGRVVKTVSGKQDKYEVADLPTGKYILQIRLADGREVRNVFLKN